MNYKLTKEVITLLEQFDGQNQHYTKDLDGFKRWICNSMQQGAPVDIEEPSWEGKEKGRSPESVINTLIVRMNRYARTYSKSAIWDSGFSTQDEFIYLINLKAFGAMTKMELIKRNIQDKPAGMQIITRLIQQGWVEQQGSETDKRSKIIQITSEGLHALENQMGKIRQATNIVTGNLNRSEKMELIRLLNKLDHFHHSIFSRSLASADLLDTVLKEYLPHKN